MARPTKPKDIKPKADGEIATLPTAVPGGGGGGSGGLDLKFIITLVVVVLCTTLTSGASVYFLAPMVLLPAIEHKLAQIKIPGGEGEHGAEGEGEGHAPKVGMNLELDEFTVNLKEDPNDPGNQYLRAKMSLNISVPDKEDCYQVQPHATAYPIDIQGGKVIGAAVSVASTPVNPVDRTQLASGGGAPADPVAACLASFKGNMAKFVPTIRDVVNAALMKRTAGTLSTLEGQEALKDEIKESISQFMGEPYQVVRVNFEDFIIQK